MLSCALTTSANPCPSCPWRMDEDATDIPNFCLELAEGPSNCCPDARGMGPDFGARVFACHQSKDGAEIACAAWVATVGHRHPGVRLARHEAIGRGCAASRRWLASSAYELPGRA